MPSNAATKNYVAVTVAHVSARVFPCLTWWRKRASEELDAFRCEWPAVFDLHHRALSLPRVLYHGVMLCLFGQGVPFVRTRLYGGSLVDSDTEFIERHSQFIVLL